MSISYKNIFNFLFFCIVLLLTRQVPLSGYSIIGNISLLLLFLFYFIYEKKIPIMLIPLLSWLGGLLFYSFFIQDNSISLAFRFFLIILFLFLSYWVHLSVHSMLKILYFLVILQCVFLIGMEIYLNVFYTQLTYLPIRNFFLEYHWGDVYTYNGFYYRVQLKGNALLPFCFCLSFIKEFDFKYNNIIKVILFLGVIIAGNFAFLISIMLFLFFWFVFYKVTLLKFIKRFFIMFIILLLTMSTIVNYISDTINMKKERSLGIRSEQSELLFNDLVSNDLSSILGKGLGNTLDIKTNFRDYTDNVYFELQSLYFLNQLGFFNFLIFISCMLIITLKRIKYFDLLFVYFIYAMYAFTNPYMLDTTNIVIILVLVGISYERIDRKKNRCDYSIV